MRASIGASPSARLSEKQRGELRYHSQVFNLSQFLHGEYAGVNGRRLREGFGPTRPSR